MGMVSAFLVFLVLEFRLLADFKSWYFSWERAYPEPSELDFETEPLALDLAVPETERKRTVAPCILHLLSFLRFATVSGPLG